MALDIRSLLGEHALPSKWTISNRLLNNRPIQYYSKVDPFRHRPWQQAPVDDWSKTIVIKKARQMGFTEVFINKQIHIATLLRCMQVYTLPKDRKAEELAKTRLNIVGKPKHPSRFSPEVRARFLNWRSMMHKQITPSIGGGESNIIWTGSWNEDIGESTACDIVYLDEFDRHKPGVITAFRMSLRSSKIGAIRIFSTPSFPNIGVEEQLKTTDNKKWVWKCPHCNHRQAFSRENLLQKKGSDSLIPRLEAKEKTALFEPGTFIVGCVRCKQYINKMEADAEWVAEKPTAEASGYSISQLDCAWISGDMIYADLRDQEEAGLRPWYNYSLGEAYAGDAGKVSEGLAYSLVDSDLAIITSKEAFLRRFPDGKVSVGIDWGKTNWFLALGTTQQYQVPIILSYDMFTDTNDPYDTVRAAIQFCRLWGASAIMADFGYGADRNPELYKMFHTKFYTIEYPSDGVRASTSQAIWGPNPTADNSCPHAVIGRAPRLKRTILNLTANPRGYSIAGNRHNLENIDLLDLHFRGIAIAAQPMKNGVLVDVATRTGPDHYLHTLGYADIGLEYIKTQYTGDVIGLDYPGSVQYENEDVDSMPSPDDVVDMLFGDGLDIM